MKEKKGGERRRRGRGEAHLRFSNLQIPHLDPTSREIRNLKLDVDRPLGLAVVCSAHAPSKATGHATAEFVVALDGGETQLGAHEELLAAAELLDFPDNGGLLGGVVHCADVGAEAGGVGVVGDGDNDFDVVGCAAAFELGFGLEAVSKRGNREDDEGKSGVPLTCIQFLNPSVTQPDTQPR